MLLDLEHGVRRDGQPVQKLARHRMTSPMRDLFVELRTFEMQKRGRGGGDGNGVGIELFRRVYLITVLVIALTREEGGWVVKRCEVRLKSGAREWGSGALCHMMMRLHLGHGWGSGDCPGIEIQACF
jgi:hypothetical protein